MAMRVAVFLCIIAWSVVAVTLFSPASMSNPLSRQRAMPQPEQLTIAEGEYKQFKILPDFRTLHLVHANGTVYVFRLAGVKGLTEE